MRLALLQSGRSTSAFWLGCALVTIGVVLHLPMYWIARHHGFVLAGMPMDANMLCGMALILIGAACAAYGLLPKPRSFLSRQAPLALAPPEDAPLSRAHWGLATLLSIALIIDIMKPASLGFVTPGMRAEYGVSDETVAWLPFSALAGTVLRSFLWGWLADVYGRRASILLSSVMFTGTSLCGAMPEFGWNVFMCFMMGAAAGGMLPVAYALLAETMPTKHRGWSLVLVGGIGAVGGYFAASWCSALLQPTFGRRIMWFLNLPTGLALIALSPLLPESARFLERVGRLHEAHAILARFGVRVRSAPAAATEPPARIVAQTLRRQHLIGLTSALTLSALTWGLVTFGLLLWLPSALVATGRSVGASSALIAQSTLFAAPTILVCTLLYSRWSTKRSLVLMSVLTIVGLFALGAQEAGPDSLSAPLVPLTLIVVGSSGLIAILLPYTAENFPLRIRGRTTGWIADCSKLGGLLAQGLSVIGAVPRLATAIVMIGILAILSTLLVILYGHETRDRDLRELEASAVAGNEK